MAKSAIEKLGLDADSILLQENRITLVEALSGFRIKLTYSDGEHYEIDFKPLLDLGGVMVPLRDPHVFAQVQIAHGGIAIEFPGEVDFCADALRLDGELARRGLDRSALGEE